MSSAPTTQETIMTTAATASLTWSQAVDQAFIPTDLDRAFNNPGDSIFNDTRIGPDGRVCKFGLIRERAAKAYIAAHEGEVATVEFTNPNHPNGEHGVRTIHRTTGELKRQYVRYVEFSPDADAYGNGNRNRDGFVVGDSVIPFDGICSIMVDGDRSVVTL